MTSPSWDRKPVGSGQVYFVEPNIGRLERRYALPADDLRFWIALHEVTHAFEFEAHPWLREYLNDPPHGLPRQFCPGTCSAAARTSRWPRFWGASGPTSRKVSIPWS